MTTTAEWPKGRPFPEGEDWDHEGEGMPGVVSAANAIQVWAALQNKPTTVRQAALSFNLDDAQVRQAVEFHNWMYLSGPDDDPTKQIIEHEGE
jgi:hypothetical protein